MAAESRQTPLTEISNAIAAAVEAASRSIVRVEARRRGNSSGIAWSADGIVLTAHHTVQRDEDLRIGLPNGDVVGAELVGLDEPTDVAVLRAANVELEPPEWTEDTAGLLVGHIVLSVGRHDTHAQAGLGILAKKGGPWRTPLAGAVDAYLHSDIGVYPGFSGSALVDAAGRTYGMNTSWFGRRSSLTIPYVTLKRVAGAIVEHGRIRRGFLGVGAHPAALPRPAADALGQQIGLLVAGVEPGSPADHAGVLVGDLIVAFGGTPTPKLGDLLALLTEERIDRESSLRIVRGGEVRELSVTVTARPQ